MLTTISELSAVKNIQPVTVRWLLNKNNVDPIERKKKVINGYQGQPYLLSDALKALSDFINNKEKPIISNKKYSNEYICQVLRNHIKNPLNNKIVKDWNFHDWQEFENLKINLNK